MTVRSPRRRKIAVQGRGRDSNTVCNIRDCNIWIGKQGSGKFRTPEENELAFIALTVIGTLTRVWPDRANLRLRLAGGIKTVSLRSKARTHQLGKGKFACLQLLMKRRRQIVPNGGSVFRGA
jgi:hypothetical protein